MAVLTVLFHFYFSFRLTDVHTAFEFGIITSFLRTATRSPCGVHKGAGLDGARGVRGVQSHYHLSGGVWWRVPVSHLYDQSAAGAAADNRSAFMSQMHCRWNVIMAAGTFIQPLALPPLWSDSCLQTCQTRLMSKGKNLHIQT